MTAFVARLGVRPTGSTAQTRYIEWISRRLRAIRGMRLSEVRFPLDRWSGSAASLRISVGGRWTTLPVADAIPYSRSTGSRGVLAPLTIIPDSRPITAADARGRIVVREADAPSIPLSVFSSPLLSWETYDPAYTLIPSDRFFGDWLGYDARVQDLEDAAAAGAKGILFVMDLPRSQISGHYEPYEGIAWGVPGMWLGVDQGAVISSAVAGGRPVSAEIVVRASFRHAVTRMILATLRGGSGRRIVVESKTDGTNAVEDDAPVAMVAMARYLASLPTSCLSRSIEFAFSTGHFYQRLVTPSVRGGATEVLARELDRDYGQGTVSVVLTLEHLGARDYEMVSRGHGRPGYELRPSGLRAIQFIGVTPSAALVAVVDEIVRRYDMRRSILLRGTDVPGNTVPTHCSFGDEGTAFLQHLLPTVAVDGAPQDLYDPAFGLDTVNFGVMRSQLLAYTALVMKLSTMKQRDIAGGVTVERRERSAGAPGCPSGVY